MPIGTVQINNHTYQRNITEDIYVSILTQRTMNSKNMRLRILLKNTEIIKNTM